VAGFEGLLNEIWLKRRWEKSLIYVDGIFGATGKRVLALSDGLFERGEGLIVAGA
jgi:hypothetical protein